MCEWMWMRMHMFSCPHMQYVFMFNVCETEKWEGKIRRREGACLSHTFNLQSRTFLWHTQHTPCSKEDYRERECVFVCVCVCVVHISRYATSASVGNESHWVRSPSLYQNIFVTASEEKRQRVRVKMTDLVLRMPTPVPLFCACLSACRSCVFVCGGFFFVGCICFRPSAIYRRQTKCSTSKMSVWLWMCSCTQHSWCYMTDRFDK